MAREGFHALEAADPVVDSESSWVDWDVALRPKLWRGPAADVVPPHLELVV